MLVPNRIKTSNTGLTSSSRSFIHPRLHARQTHRALRVATGFCHDAVTVRGGPTMYRCFRRPGTGRARRIQSGKTCSRSSGPTEPQKIQVPLLFARTFPDPALVVTGADDTIRARG